LCKRLQIIAGKYSAARCEIQAQASHLIETTAPFLGTLKKAITLHCMIARMK
jgi:hypothetical protein